LTDQGEEPLFILSLILVSLLSFWLILRFFRPSETPRLTDTAILRGVASDTLVVVLHAFTGSAKHMQKVIQVTTSALGEPMDIFCPSFNVGPFSNTSITKLAARIEDNIEQLWDEKIERDNVPYRRVIMIGHSAGALLTRKVYLYGRGGSVDYPQGRNKNSASTWAAHVERIVLLAGINRGWSTENMNLSMRLMTFAGRVLHRFFHLGHFIFSIERGTPFVSDLKMEWMRLHHEGNGVPDVIQLLGDDDEVAPESDHKELMASPGFIFIPVSNATHINIIDMPMESDDLDLRIRAAKFRETLIASKDQLLEKYDSNRHYLDNVDSERTAVDHVVFVVHGIRDYGEWVNQLAQEIEAQGHNIRAITSKYGHFSMAGFLFLSDREKNVRWFVDQYLEAVALYPKARKFSFVGHSNGTYLLASALEKYHAIRFDSVYFAGSVVRNDFPWNAYVNQGRVGKVRNDVACKDAIVAIFPKAYQVVRKFLKLNSKGFFNLGGAGFDGFEVPDGNRLQGLLNGGHGAGVKVENFESIVNFVINDSNYLPAMAKGPNPVIRIFSNFSPFVLMFLAALIVVIGFLIFYLFSLFSITSAQIAVAVYVFIVLAALNFV
jgi:alpha-beta hydrolase superfamily lysophospholipase